jgi:hypothetical protein
MVIWGIIYGIVLPTLFILGDLKMISSTIIPLNTIKLMTGWWLSHPSEKYDFVSWDDDIPNIWKNKTCSQPPTR